MKVSVFRKAYCAHRGSNMSATLERNNKTLYMCEWRGVSRTEKNSSSNLNIAHCTLGE